MNPKGNKRNLRASQPGNSNAQRTGLYSERERAKRARKLRQGLDKDPQTALDSGLQDRYCKLRAISDLLHEYVIEHGVSDRHGKQSRQTGSYLRTITMLDELEGQIRTGLATAAIEDDTTQLWDHGAIKRRLQAIADDHSLPGGARVKALGDLLRESPQGELPYEDQYTIELISMTDEELDRELAYLQVPVQTGRPHGAGRSTVPERPDMLIRRIGSQDTITDYDLVDLRDSLHAFFNPGPYLAARKRERANAPSDADQTSSESRDRPAALRAKTAQSSSSGVGESGGSTRHSHTPDE